MFNSERAVLGVWRPRELRASIWLPTLLKYERCSRSLMLIKRKKIDDQTYWPPLVARLGSSFRRNRFALLLKTPRRDAAASRLKPPRTNWCELRRDRRAGRKVGPVVRRRCILKSRHVWDDVEKALKSWSASQSSVLIKSHGPDTGL